MSAALPVLVLVLSVGCAESVGALHVGNPPVGPVYTVHERRFRPASDEAGTIELTLSAEVPIEVVLRGVGSSQVRAVGGSWQPLDQGDVVAERVAPGAFQTVRIAYRKWDEGEIQVYIRPVGQG